MLNAKCTHDLGRSHLTIVHDAPRADHGIVSLAMPESIADLLAGQKGAALPEWGDSGLNRLLYARAG